MKRLLLKNSLTGVIQTAINLILLIIAVPIFIKTLGKEYYGIFSLVMVIGNLNIFTNLGLNRALLKFLAEQGKSLESDHDIIVNFLLLVTILMPLFLIIVYYHSFLLINIFGLSSALASQAKWLLIGAATANIFIMLGQIPKAILDSMQKIYITSWLQALYSFTYWGLIIVTANKQDNLGYIGLAVATSSIVWFIAICFFALHQWNIPSCHNLSKNISKIAKKQLSYGGKIYTGSLISFFFEPLTKIMISHFIGIPEVGYFDIVLRLKAQIQTFFQRVFAPLAPLLAKWGDSQQTRYLVHDLEKKIILITLPLSCIALFTLTPFLDLWLPSHAPIIDITAKIIIISFVIFSTSALPSYTFFIACNFPHYIILIQLTNTLINASILWMTYKSIGFHAVSISSAIAIFGSFIITIQLQNKIFSTTIFSEYIYLGKVLFSTIVTTSICYYVSLHFNNSELLLLIIPITTAICSIIQYRLFCIITHKDINYYLGGSYLSKKLQRLLVIPPKNKGVQK